MLEDRVAPCPQQLTGNVHRDKYRGKKFQPQIRLIKDKNGTILPENEDIKLRWKEFCVACTQKLFYLSFFTFSFRSIQKHRRAPERNERELARSASSSPTPTPCTGGQKIPPGFCFLSRALDWLWRENRGSVNRLNIVRICINALKTRRRN